MDRRFSPGSCASLLSGEDEADGMVRIIVHPASGDAMQIPHPLPRPPLRYLWVMPIDDLQQAAQKIANFLGTLNKLGGMRLKYRITAGDGARDPQGLEARLIYVELGGPDVPTLTQHNG